jgi:hypothetical protein
MAKIAIIHTFTRPVDPGYGQPGFPGQGLPGAPPRPDQGLPPAQGRPDQGLPPAQGRPDQGLPPAQGRPDQGLPPYPGLPSHPITLPPEIWPPNPPTVDNSLPEGELPANLPTVLPIFPPAGDWTKPVDPDQRFALKYSPVYGWVLVPANPTDPNKPQPKR